MLENLKNQIHQGINELFANAVLDEMAGDTAAYAEKLKIIGVIAAQLSISMEITEVSLNLSSANSKSE